MKIDFLKKTIIRRAAFVVLSLLLALVHVYCNRPSERANPPTDPIDHTPAPANPPAVEPQTPPVVDPQTPPAKEEPKHILTVGSKIVLSNTTDSSTTVSWGAATDTQTPTEQLKYKLVKSSLPLTSLAQVNAVTGSDVLLDFVPHTTVFNVIGLYASTTYYFTVVVQNASSEQALYSSVAVTTNAKVIIEPVPDKQAPIVGSAIVGSLITAQGLLLSWGRASDNLTAANELMYKVVKSNDISNIDTVAKAQALTGASIIMDWTQNVLQTNVSGLNEASVYAFAVLVQDASKNQAIYSPQLITTLDVTSPVITSGISYSAKTATELDVHLGLAHDNVTLDQALLYKIVQSTRSDTIDSVSKINALTGADLIQDWTVNHTSVHVTGLSNHGSYYFAALVKDESNNHTLYPPVLVTTLDEIGPVPGAAINYSVITGHSLFVNWGAATDNLTPASLLEYKVVHGLAATDIDSVIKANAVSAANIVLDWTPHLTGVSATGLSDASIHYFAVLVKDADGNQSLYSPVAVTTPDVTPPAPSVGVISHSCGFLSCDLYWGRGSDNVTLPASLQYQVLYSTSNNIDSLASAQANGTVFMDWTTDVTSTTITGLSRATTYYFNILVRDTATNKSAYGGSLFDSTMNAKFVFASNSTYNGNLGGIAGADAKCNSDLNKPSDTIYKAYIVDGVNRIACTTPGCSTGPSEHKDWVSTANTTYILNNADIFMITDANGIFSFLNHSIMFSSGNFWDGFDSNFTTHAQTCTRWSSVALSGGVGVGGVFTANAF